MTQDIKPDPRKESIMAETSRRLDEATGIKPPLASDSPLHEWEKLAKRLQTLTRPNSLEQKAAEAIPALIAMVRTRDANINRKADFIEATINDCATLESRATAAEARANELAALAAHLQFILGNDRKSVWRDVQLSVSAEEAVEAFTATIDRATAAEARVAELEKRERHAFSAGFWAYCGPATGRELDLATCEEAESWEEYVAARAALGRQT